MALKRLGFAVVSHIPLCILAAVLALPPELYAQVTPIREIVTVDSPDVPQWKSFWDSAREQSRQGNFREAAEYYEELLRRKPQIEEAKWEYSKILVKVERYAEASVQLESLIEENPYQKDYLALAGYAALETGEYGRAVRYLGQVYSLKPGGEEGEKALRGLIRGLKGLGKSEYAFVLMEQLRQRTPNDPSLLHDLAKTAYELGYIEKAGDYYSDLIYKEKGSKDAVMEAAEMFVSTGNEEKAVPLWKKLLQIDPDNIEYHERLLDYYRKKGATDEALPHLLSLLDTKGNIDSELILEIARIYHHDQGRADKSLRYYELYLQVHPHDDAVAKDLENARKQIAVELLAIVENDGAKQLWDDLKVFTNNRLAIYQIMADTLERSGKVMPLIQVLEIINQQPDGNTEVIALKLAELYISIGKRDAAYTCLLTITGSQYLTYPYYRQRAELELQLGYDVAALDSLMLALAKRPDLADLRGDCINLAGKLGFVTKLLELGRPLIATSISEKEYDLYLMYLEGLRLNGQYGAAMSLYSRMLDTVWPNVHYREKILLDQAESLKAMGREFESQKILRTMLVAGQAEQEVAVQLIAYAINSNSLVDGWELFRYLTRKPRNASWKTSYNEDRWKLFLSYTQLLAAEGKYSAASQELEKYIGQFPERHQSSEVKVALNTLNLQMCRLYLLAGQKEKCKAIVSHFEATGKQKAEMLFLEGMILGKGGVDPVQIVGTLPGMQNGKGGIGDVFTAADQAVIFDNDTAALGFVSEILKFYPYSLRAKLEKAVLLKRLGLLAEASVMYKELWHESDDDMVLYQEYLSMEFKLGHYDVVMSELGNKKIDELPDEMPIDQKLLKTRTLWAMNKRSEAFALYQEMLSPSVSTRFRDRLAEEKLQFNWQEKEKQAFWDVFSYERPDQMEKLNVMHGDEGFLAMLKTPVAEVAADMYDSYRWEKLISSEYSVRKAVEENKYIIAEKQFKKNIHNEKSTESLKDLARIYERLGDYGKEAEVYSYLEKQGEKTPEIQESIERNKIARAPTLGVNYGYLEKEGRGDQIDLQKHSAGLSFKYLPELNSSLEIEYGELFYDSATGEGDGVNGRRFNGKGMYALNEKTAIELGLGLHILDSEGESTPLLDFRLDRKLDEILSGYVQYKQEIIDDTLEALKQSLSTSSITGGLVLEGATGVNIGGEYQRLWYDDNNIQNRLQFWGSYSIFSELTTYELKYSYELISTKDSETVAESAIAGSGTAESFKSQMPLPYWRPSDYWQQLFSLRIHHLLKDTEDAERPPSYYSFELSAGYESVQNVIYSGSFDIFLEIGGNYLLKGELLYSDSSDYKEQSAAVSVMYRW